MNMSRHIHEYVCIYMNIHLDTHELRHVYAIIDMWKRIFLYIISYICTICQRIHIIMIIILLIIPDLKIFRALRVQRNTFKEVF
jgi:hypothetical protein